MYMNAFRVFDADYFSLCMQLLNRVLGIHTSTLAVGVIVTAASWLQMFAAEPATVPVPLTDAERSVFLAELKPLQTQLAELRQAPNISPDRWADADIFVKAVVWALDFGPVTDDRSRGLVKFGLKRARERVD